MMRHRIHVDNFVPALWSRAYKGVKRLSSAIGIVAWLLSPAYGAGPTFVPDSTFKGSNISSLHVFGQADWHAENGELVGRPKPGGNGGWLLLDKPLQDAAFYASFQCTGGCKTGVMVRTETGTDGIKGDFVSLTEGDQAAYKLALDMQGQDVHREKVRPVGPMIRFAPKPGTPAAAAGNRGPAREVIYHSGEWNAVQIIVDADIIRASLNGSQGPGAGATDDDGSAFGPIALYVGGTGEVRFKDVSYKDLNVKTAPPEQTSNHFRRQRLDEFDYSWGVTAADIDHDGTLDVIAGPYWFRGPDYTQKRELDLSEAISPSAQYPSTMVDLAYDFTGDGWPDVIKQSVGHPLTLYVNPKGEPRRWNKYDVTSRTNTEIALLKDIDGDGKPDVVCGVGGVLMYLSPDPAHPTEAWTIHKISGPNGVGAHGLGVGDINGDGRPDVLTVAGWYEHPANKDQMDPWTFHAEKFGTMGGAEMAVYDVNGDGLNDVVTGLSAHGFGLSWFEQKRNGESISFTEHKVMDDFLAENAGHVLFTELHGATFADVDGDGVPDFIVGKRYWSHEDSYTDPDPYGPPVLYWYRTVRNKKAPGGAELIPELIDNRSGAGSQITALDLNGDGAVDVLTSTTRGTFVFWGNSKHSKKK